MDDLVFVLRLVLGLVFGVSAATKFRDPAGFIRGVHRYGILPRRLNTLAALLVIAVEAIVALSLLSGMAARTGILLGMALLMLFSTVMMQNARHAQPLPCYCFGADDSEVRPRRTLVRLGLLVVAALVTVVGVIEGSRSLVVRPALGPFLLALAVLVLGMWGLRVPDLLEWHRTPLPTYVPPPRRVSLREVPLQPVRIIRDERTLA